MFNSLIIFLFQAGGRGTNGSQDILDIVPKTIHDRTQVTFNFYKSNILQLQTFHKK